jgi:hypothetical protein
MASEFDDGECELEPSPYQRMSLYSDLCFLPPHGPVGVVLVGLQWPRRHKQAAQVEFHLRKRSRYGAIDGAILIVAKRIFNSAALVLD